MCNCYLAVDQGNLFTFTTYQKAQATTNVHWQIVHYLHIQGCPCSCDTTSEAFRGGHCDLSMLQWLRTTNHCTCHTVTFFSAAEHVLFGDIAMPERPMREVAAKHS
jgi:hypothetical protein